MRKVVVFLWLAVAAVVLSCGGRKRDAAYYERMVDSIRRAEQVSALQHEAGIYSDPVVAFFDTLRLHSLPIRSVESRWDYLGRFTRVPKVVNQWLGYPETATLRALRLPKVQQHPVVLLADVVDSLTTNLYLCTLDDKRQLIDLLCIYEERDEDRQEDFGKSYIEYFITSTYEITLMQYYRSFLSARTQPQLEQARRYVIDREGRFEEVVIELE